MIALRPLMLRLTFALFLLVGGWALLTVTAGPARADTGEQVTSGGQALHRAVVVPALELDELSRLPVDPSVRATQASPSTGMSAPGLARVLPASVSPGPTTAIHPLAANARTGHASAAIVPATVTSGTASAAIGRASSALARPHRSPHTGARGEERSAGVELPAIAAESAHSAIGRGPALSPSPSPSPSGPDAEAPRGATGVPHNSPAPADGRAPAATTPWDSHGPSLPTLPTPAEPGTPTVPSPASWHASTGADAHAHLFASAGSPAPVLAHARVVLDVDHVGDDMGGLPDPGSRPD